MQIFAVVMSQCSFAVSIQKLTERIITIYNFTKCVVDSYKNIQIKLDLAPDEDASRGQILHSELRDLCAAAQIDILERGTLLHEGWQ